MSTRTLRRVVEAYRKRKAKASFVADMLSDAADVIDNLRAVHAASLRRVRWIRVGDYSVAHFGRRVAAIRWKAGNAALGGDLYLVPSGENIAAFAAFFVAPRLGFVTSVEAATRLLRKAR